MSLSLALYNISHLYMTYSWNISKVIPTIPIHAAVPPGTNHAMNGLDHDICILALTL